MKNWLIGGGVAALIVLVFVAIILGFRAMDRATANLTIRTVEPGVNCAVLLDRTTQGGNAISCYASPNPVQQ